MPLGGFCETCGRWVWVNGYGDCENGHPAERGPRRAATAAAGLERAGRHPAPSGRRAAAAPLVVAPLAVARLDLRPRLQLARVLLHRGARSARGVDRVGPHLPARRRERDRPRRRWLELLAHRPRGGPPVQGVSVLQGFLVRPQYRALMFGDAPIGSLPAPPPLLRGPGVRRCRRARTRARRRSSRAAHERVDGSEAADHITHPEVRDRVARLCTSAEKILDELRKEPRQVDLARGFLTYYLEAAYRIVRGYASLLRATSPRRRSRPRSPGRDLARRDPAGLRQAARRAPRARGHRPRQRGRPAREDRPDGQPYDHGARRGERLTDDTASTQPDAAADDRRTPCPPRPASPPPSWPRSRRSRRPWTSATRRW